MYVLSAVKNSCFADILDGKLPIHSRLGVPVEAAKKKRKRNKNRSGGGPDQVLCFGSFLFDYFSLNGCVSVCVSAA